MIRLADVFDLDECVEIGRHFVLDSVYSDMPIDISKMRQYAEAILWDPDSLFLVSEKDEKITGFFIARITDALFSHSLIASQELMYVMPSERSGRHAIQFLKRFRDWAEENKCERLYFAPSACPDQDFSKLVEHLGYEYLGPQYGIKL